MALPPNNSAQVWHRPDSHKAPSTAWKHLQDKNIRVDPSIFSVAYPGLGISNTLLLPPAPHGGSQGISRPDGTHIIPRCVLGLPQGNPSCMSCGWTQVANMSFGWFHPPLKPFFNQIKVFYQDKSWQVCAYTKDLEWFLFWVCESLFHGAVQVFVNRLIKASHDTSHLIKTEIKNRNNGDVDV